MPCMYMWPIGHIWLKLVLYSVRSKHSELAPKYFKFQDWLYPPRRQMHSFFLQVPILKNAMSLLYAPPVLPLQRLSPASLHSSREHWLVLWYRNLNLGYSTPRGKPRSSRGSKSSSQYQSMRRSLNWRRILHMALYSSRSTGLKLNHA